MREYLVGSYAQPDADSIFRIGLDEASKQLKRLASYRCAQNPSYLLMHPNRKVLYAVEECVPNGRIAVLTAKGNELVCLCEFPSGGSAPCHLEIDPAGKYLFISNYMSGSLSVYALDQEGIPVEMTDRKQHTGKGLDPRRQEGPHVHSSRYIDGFLYVCDLGLDTVFCYRVDLQSGKLLETDKSFRLADGCGPRHTCVVPALPNILYVDCELSGDIYVCDLTRHAILQKVSVLPEGHCGSFLVSAIKNCGDMLYVGNRGFDSFAAFRVLGDGRLELRHITPHKNKTPRDFLCEKGFILSADQDAGQAALLELQDDGSPAYVCGCSLSPAMPAFILSIR